MAHEQRLLFGGRSFLTVVHCGNQEFLIGVEYLKNWELLQLKQHEQTLSQKSEGQKGRLNEQ